MSSQLIPLTLQYTGWLYQDQNRSYPPITAPSGGGTTYDDTISAGSVTLSESLSPGLQMENNNVSESVTPSDSLAVGLTISSTLSDSVTVTDSNAVVLTASASTSESVTMTDAMFVAATFSASLSETATMIEPLEAASTVNDSLSSTVTMTDSMTGVATLLGGLSDSVTVTFTASIDGTVLDDSFSESVTPSYSLQVELLADLFIEEAVTVSESSALLLVIEGTVTEAIMPDYSMAVDNVLSEVIEEAVTPSFDATPEGNGDRTIDFTGVEAGYSAAEDFVFNAQLMEVVDLSSDFDAQVQFEGVLSESVTVTVAIPATVPGQEEDTIDPNGMIHRRIIPPLEKKDFDKTNN